MLHLMKLAVGARDVAHLAEFQAARLAAQPPLRHRTRNRPRRAAELCAGGSIYWVVAGAMVVRQRVLDVVEARHDDGTACADLLLDARLVPVVGRALKPFQGWRYLQPGDAPADLAAIPRARGAAALPPGLTRDLRALCLL